MEKRLKRVVNDIMFRFIVVGLINTAIDFTILNLLAHGVGLPRIMANVISVSFAMVFSFFANRVVVFNSKSEKKQHQAMMFLIVTISSIYILQNLIIFSLTDLWTWPLETLHNWINLLDSEVFMTNVAKIVATLASLVWNFMFYKRYVFKDD